MALMYLLVVFLGKVVYLLSLIMNLIQKMLNASMCALKTIYFDLKKIKFYKVCVYY